MTETPLLQRLDGIDARFEEVSLLITDPSVINDMKRFVKLTKEYKDLERLTKVTNRYKQMLRDIDEAKEVLESESDPDMRELAKDELDSNTAKLPEIEEEIKLLLIPADPEDDKNVILEIRGGTGGDEAAIFAGDLFRMYSKYCESKGWKLEVMSYSEGAAGGFKEIISSVTGEKFRQMLREGKLEDREVEVTIRRQPRGPSMEIIAGGSLDDLQSGMQDLQNILTGRNLKKKMVTVREARKILQAETLDSMIDPDKVADIAKQRVEQSGIVFIDEIDKIATKNQNSSGQASRCLRQ